jgi:hypothetical protein
MQLLEHHKYVQQQNKEVSGGKNRWRLALCKTSVGGSEVPVMFVAILR